MEQFFKKDVRKNIWIKKIRPQKQEACFKTLLVCSVSFFLNGIGYMQSIKNMQGIFLPN